MSLINIQLNLMQLILAIIALIWFGSYAVFHMVWKQSHTTPTNVRVIATIPVISFVSGLIFLLVFDFLN